ncbi:hypothetical protein G6F40_014491 [Rhizopus arrhizus]|nr:hypothetical protein G6F40_014491 [Rhizopus arrhizus]
MVEQFGLAMMPRGRIVDHHRTGGSELRRVFLRHAATGREQGDLDAGRVESGQGLHRDLLAVELDLATGRTLGGQDAQGTNREITFFKDRQHGLANRAGGTDDGDVETALCIAHGGKLSRKRGWEKSRTTAGFGEPPQAGRAEVPYRFPVFLPRVTRAAIAASALIALGMRDGSPSRPSPATRLSTASSPR